MHGHLPTSGCGVRTGPVRVLVADDDAPFRRLVRLVLEDAPHVQIVAEAATGADAIRLATALLPDVILLDLSMPGMGGFEAMPRMQAASPRSRIVVVSGSSERDDGSKARYRGAQAYVEKAFDLDELRDRLLAIIEGRDAGGDAPRERGQVGR